MQSQASIRPSQKTALPPPPAGWFPVVYAITIEGHLARLCTTVDIYRLRELAEPSGHVNRLSLPPKSPLRADIFDGLRISPGPTFALENVLPKFDCLRDGRWIVADGRTSPEDVNARVIGPTGNVMHRMYLGDGVLHLQCDRNGSIWVGYFDEGVFGGDEFGMAGINRFDDRGQHLPLYRPGDIPELAIDDCYALNAATSGVWICPYSEFPIVRLGYDGIHRLWHNSVVKGAKAIAVDGDHVVLVGGYQERRNRGALLELRENTADLVWEFQFDVDGLDFDSLRLVVARNDQIHFVANNAWHRIDVATIRDKAR